MSGLAGFIGSDAPDKKQAVADMVAAMRHRGPNSKGSYDTENLALAGCRNAIVDRKLKNPPLISKDKNLVLFFDGEIYNHHELRKELEDSGSPFETDNDAECIVHLYLRHGIDGVKYLQGMFAFVLWDQSLNTLYLVRDRLGEKPLYYYKTDGGFWFASEMKGLLASGAIPKKLNVGSAALMLYYGYVPSPRTAVEGVAQLQPGHVMQIGAKNGNVSQEPYWSILDAPVIEEAASSSLAARLENTIIKQAKVDVPVGVSLSGGLDSSLIACLAKRHCASDLYILSLGFKGFSPEDDETGDALKLATHLQLPFKRVELSTQEMVEFFPKLNFWRDDPVADLMGYASYALSQAAHQSGIRVLLQGHGGDELFWGHFWLKRALQDLRRAYTHKPWFILPMHFADKVIPDIQAHIGSKKGVKQLVKYLCHLNKQAGKGHSNFHEASPDFMRAVQSLPLMVTEKTKKSLYDLSANPYACYQIGDGSVESEVWATKLLWESELLCHAMSPNERLCMANSVEMRLPLLDYRFVETVIGTRKHRDDSALTPKARLREAMDGIVPDFVLDRPKKMPKLPASQWFYALFEKYGSQLKDGYLVQHDFLSEEGAAYLGRGRSAPDATIPLSFKMLVLEQWCRQMLG